MTRLDPSTYVFAAVAFCGLAGVSPWLAVPLAVVGLQALTINSYLDLYERAHAVGVGAVWWRTVALSIGLALMAASATFMAGMAARWLWGVM